MQVRETDRMYGKSVIVTLTSLTLTVIATGHKGRKERWRSWPASREAKFSVMKSIHLKYSFNCVRCSAAELEKNQCRSCAYYYFFLFFILKVFKVHEFRMKWLIKMVDTSSWALRSDNFIPRALNLLQSLVLVFLYWCETWRLTTYNRDLKWWITDAMVRSVHK